MCHLWCISLESKRSLEERSKKKGKKLNKKEDGLFVSFVWLFSNEIKEKKNFFFFFFFPNKNQGLFPR
jgi:hypothetical protein